MSKRAILVIHELLLAEHGGAQGILDAHLLDSALESPKNHIAYSEPDIFDLAAIYAYALTQDHPFVDGNKRVALTVAFTFLEKNGFRVSAPEPEAAQIVLDLSSRRANAALFAEWLRGHSEAIVRKKATTKRKVARVVRKRK